VPPLRAEMKRSMEATIHHFKLPDSCSAAKCHELNGARAGCRMKCVDHRIGRCCARAVSGHASAPPSSVMNARRLSRSDVIGCYRHQCNEGAPAPSSVILPIRSRIQRPGGLAPPAPGPDGSEELPDPLGAGFLGAALAPFFFVVVAWPVVSIRCVPPTP
jgi:hypothetical protein